MDLELFCYPALTHIRKLKSVIYLNLKLNFQILSLNPDWNLNHTYEPKLFINISLVISELLAIFSSNFRYSNSGNWFPHHITPVEVSVSTIILGIFYANLMLNFYCHRYTCFIKTTLTSNLFSVSIFSSVN